MRASAAITAAPALREGTGGKVSLQMSNSLGGTPAGAGAISWQDARWAGGGRAHAGGKGLGCAVTLACGAILAGALVRGAQAQANDPCGFAAGDPCPQGIERLCSDFATPGHGPAGPSLFCDCACGTGFWLTESGESSLRPARPTSSFADGEQVNSTFWSWNRSSEAQRFQAEARVSARGVSTFWHAGSFTRASTARYSTQEFERWMGSGPPCPRYVQLIAMGGGILEITLTCSAQAGCSATASSSLSGSCASRGDASAWLDGKTVDGTVLYRSSSHTTKVEGKFGTAIDDTSTGVEGKISSQVSWELTGSGTVSGSASYTVKPDRTYCAFTNRPIVRSATGMVVCTGGATVDWNGSASFDAMALVALRVH